jgi:hypothetical protein
MIQCIATCASVQFEILEYLSQDVDMKKREGEYIRENANNPLLLNRAHDPYSNRGIKWTKEEKEKTRRILIEKVKSGQIVPYGHRYMKKRRPTEELFKSKLFGDKE